MWSYEHSAETTAERKAIWALWADVDGWPSWNGDIERIRIEGPFAAGRTISMTPVGEDEVRLRLAEVSENESFIDEAEIDGLVIRTAHRIDAAGENRVRIVYRMEITGRLADELGPRLGPQISADFPDTIAELIRRAEAASSRIGAGADPGAGR
jgi:hypothetical protein